MPCGRSEDPETVYAGLRSGVRLTSDGGRSWADGALPELAVFSLAVSAADGAVYAGTEPSRLFRSDDGGPAGASNRALLELPSRPTWSFPPRPWTSHVRWIAPSPFRRRPAPGRDRAGRPHAIHGRGIDLAGSPPGRAARRPLTRLAPSYVCQGVRGRRRRRGVERGRTATPGNRPTRAVTVTTPGLSPSTRRIPSAGTSPRAPALTLPMAAETPRRASIVARRAAWRPLAGGLPDPLPAMPYALLAATAASSPASPTGRSGRAATAATAGAPARSAANRRPRSTRSYTRARNFSSRSVKSAAQRTRPGRA